MKSEKAHVSGFRSLKDTDENQLLHAFNEAFANYFVTVQLTLEQLRQKIRSDHVDLDLCVGAFDNDRLVGFILHAFDCIDGQNTVYNGGTGVIPSHRGQGLTRRMYDCILPKLRERNIDVVLLEVIAQNAPAIKIYESMGFAAERRLPCYRGKIIAHANTDITVQEMTHYDWRILKSFWDFSPTWQNSVLVLNELTAQNKLLGAFRDEQLAGYLVYNPMSKRVQQFAVHPDFRRQHVAATLFAHVSTLQDEPFVIINVDGRSAAANAFLKKMGMEAYVEQVGMRMSLAEGRTKVD
jgi:ribosomal protein S18 acetylase RimI-like enzyme